MSPEDNEPGRGGVNAVSRQGRCPKDVGLEGLKLTAERLVLTAPWAEAEQGQSQGLATISDRLWRGPMCHGTAVPPHTSMSLPLHNIPLTISPFEFHEF